MLQSTRRMATDRALGHFSRWPNFVAAQLFCLLCCAAWVSGVALAQTPSSRPDLYVLAVGVSTYQDSRLTPLRYADDDARAIARWADEQKQHIYQEVHVRTLLNEQATRSAVIHDVVDFFRAAGPQDQLVLFLAGHGVVEKDTGRYHFLAWDTQVDNIAGTALEQKDVLDKLELQGHPRNRVLVLVDTCHGGALSNALAAGERTRGVMFESGTPEQLSDLDVSSKGTLWAVFSAGSATDKAEEGARYRLEGEPAEVEGHGLFSWALLSALGSTKADADHNGTVTLSEFQRFVEATVKEKSAGKQLPLLSGKMMDVALAWAVGTRETCDGVDNNLDGRIDEDFPDLNRNGVADCLDKEICNGVDDNSNGEVDEGYDLDRDGHRSMALCGSEWGDDCNDTDIAIHPGQKDWGNLRDDDCDGAYDEEDFDLNNNAIPDLMEKQFNRLSRNRWISTGVATALLLGGGVAWYQLEALKTVPSGVEDPYFLDNEQVQLFNQLRIGTGVLLGAAVPVLGVSLKFTFDARDFRHDLFPKPRRLQGAAAVAVQH